MSATRHAEGPLVHLYDREDLKAKKREPLWGERLRIGEEVGKDGDGVFQIMEGKGH